MANISSGILGESSTFNLKEMPNKEIRSKVHELFVGGEEIVQAFKTVRDQVIFTSKRILVVNVQGLTGKRISYFSYPYSKVQFFGIETADYLISIANS